MIINISASGIFEKKASLADALRDLADRVESSVTLGPQFQIIKPGATVKGSCDMYYQENGNQG